MTLTFPEVHMALLSRVGVYAGCGAEFHLRSAGRGFFAEFRWPGPRLTLDVILLGVGDCFYLHLDINIYVLDFQPRESEVGEVLSLRYSERILLSPAPESFAILRFCREELTYTFGLFGPKNVKEWVLVRQPED